MNPLHGNVPWDSVTIIKKRAPPVQNKKVAINKALQQGEQVELAKKYNAATNKHQGTSLNTAKLDAETEKLSHNKVGLETGRLIQQARAAKNWKREEFATKICEKVQVVTEYENGSAIPNNQIFAKMERALGVKLRGKDKGQPLAPPAPKASASSTAKSKAGTSTGNKKK
jgi:putative transcription factor